MATIADIVSDVRRRVYGSMTENVNLIQTSASAGQTSIQLELGVDGIQRGMLLSSGMNVWFVKGVYSTDNTVFVIPGYDGSPQEAVNPGDMVYVRPRMTDWFAFNAINDQLRRLSSPDSGLYRIGTWVTNVDPTYQTYPVPSEAANMTNVLRVRWRWPGTTDVWTDLAPRYYRWIFSTEQNVVRVLIIRGLGGKDSIDEALKPIVLGLEELLTRDVGVGAVTIGYPHRCWLVSCLASLSLDDSTACRIWRH